MTTTLVLFMVAIANLFSKKFATIYGILFTVVLFVVFTVSERINRRKHENQGKGLEQFNLEVRADIEESQIQARPGCVLVAVRDYNQMSHLQSILRKTNMRRHDIVVVLEQIPKSGDGRFHFLLAELLGGRSSHGGVGVGQTAGQLLRRLSQDDGDGRANEYKYE